MIDFATLQGLTIPEGVVTKITDASGRVLWALNVGGPVVLEVAKITSDTYAGETTYTGEEFILLDIYPKTNGTVKVTYGGLTKTITDTSGAAEPNAQQVFFGTFNGVSDEVETPASGTLTIEGGCVGVGVGSYAYTSGKNSNKYCSCVTAITDFGGITQITDSAFYGCKLQIDEISEGVVSIGDRAFYSNYAYDGKPRRITLPSTLQSFYASAFANPSSISGDPDCFYLNAFIMLATTPPALNMENVSLYQDAALFVVPKGCSEAYKAEDSWSSLTDYIFEEGLNTFTINGEQYEMMAGMSWGEWLESSFNTGGFYTSRTTVMAANGHTVNHANGSISYTYDTLYPSESFTFVT